MVVRYPAPLEQLYTNEKYTLKKIVAILGVTERTVYRWLENGYLERDFTLDTPTYMVNEAAKPGTRAKIAAVKRKYTDEDLEDIYERIKDGRLNAVIDLNDLIKNHADSHNMLGQALKGLDEFREFVVYMIRR